MQHNNGRRNNNNRRFKNNNNKRRFGGGGGSSNNFDDESQNISMQQRKNFANKYTQYLQKAKDCLSNGDRYEAENYYQHADHCYRMMNLGLRDGAKFDPQRMNIFNPNQQQHHNEQGEQNEQAENGAPSETVAEAAPQEDLSNLSFLQAPIEDASPEARAAE